jgi:NosR/NirI family nitrous oxide reductase transcriptional regulator
MQLEKAECFPQRVTGLPPLILQILRLGGTLFAVLVIVLSGTPAQAGAKQTNEKKAEANLARFLKTVTASEVIPGADRLETLKEDPPTAVAYKGNKKVGYVFLNSGYVKSIGYSGKPIHILIALNPQGVITYVKLVEHHEPIVIEGIPEARIAKVLKSYIGLKMANIVNGSATSNIDIVSGATVTVMVMDDTILRSSIKVARRFELGGLKHEIKKAATVKITIDMAQNKLVDWKTLTGDGSVRHLGVTVGAINKAFANSGDPIAARRPEKGAPDKPYIDLYTALVSVPTIGRSLIGDREYKNLKKVLKPGQQAIVLLANGRFSFKGTAYVRGGIFDRFQVIQGDNAYRFRDKQHKRLSYVSAKGAPRFKEVDLFMLPDDGSFDPAAPWRLKLLVSRVTGATKKAFLTLDLNYAIAPHYLKTERIKQVAAKKATPPWEKMWRLKIVELTVLSVALLWLTVIFFFQDWLVKRPRLTSRVRLGFLLFTLFGIGSYANAQLSIVNVMTFFNAMLAGFSWNYFLMEPLIFILWGAVAISLLFWGRGVFCGWLCPFGAMQEILNKIAKKVRIPQIPMPWGLHERLWPLKYVIFLGLLGLSVYSMALAERLAEIEPFKTAIILKFVREWPFVLFAVSLLAVGLFIERFYCRYLCPLGAALAIPGRMRMFEWLRRYKECGSPCHRCATDCMVQAIHPDGHINPNECLYCLNCQVLYHDDHRCPVVIEKRLKRERRAALSVDNIPTNAKPIDP